MKGIGLDILIISSTLMITCYMEEALPHFISSFDKLIVKVN